MRNVLYSEHHHRTGRTGPARPGETGTPAMNMLKAGLIAALMAGVQPAAAETTIVFDNFLAPNDALWTDVMLPWIADVEKVTEAG